MPTLRQLRYFAAVAQTGSATRAAALLNVSQPSISAAIRELEADLGRALFLRRQAQGLELTPFGAESAREAREILARVESMMNRTGTPLRLALGYFATLGPTWVPGIAANLETSLPDMTLELQECDLEGIARFLANGVIDCALSYDVGLPPGTERTVLTEVRPHALLPGPSACHARRGQPCRACRVRLHPDRPAAQPRVPDGSVLAARPVTACAAEDPLDRDGPPHGRRRSGRFASGYAAGRRGRSPVVRDCPQAVAGRRAKPTSCPCKYARIPPQSGRDRGDRSNPTVFRKRRRGAMSISPTSKTGRP